MGIPSIENAFIKQFESETHVAYQQKGSILRGLVRKKTNVVGTETTFQKYGKGVAGKKTRHGKIPVMNVAHDNVTCVLDDDYAGEWVDNLDLIKTNQDERSNATNAAAWALGRQADQYIISAATTGAPQSVDATASGLTLNKIMEAKETLLDNDIDDDGRIINVLSNRQFMNMLKINEFVNADFAGDRYPLLKGTEARMFMNMLFVQHNGLAGRKTANCTNFMFHTSALGLADGASVSQKWSWENQNDSWFLNSSMSMGAVRIDDEGVVLINAKDDGTI